MKQNEILYKIAGIGISIVTACSVLGGCSGKDNGSAKETGTKLTKAGTYPIIKGGKMKLSAYTIALPAIKDFETNDFTKFLEKKTGIHIDFQTGSPEEWEDKLNMTLQGDDYPDIIFGTMVNTEKYGVGEGIFIPLDKYINEKNCPNYIKAMKQYDMNLTRDSDGKIYSLARIDDSYHVDFARKMWVNKKYLKEMGVEVPKTTQEFAAVCKKFKAYKPNGVAIAGSPTGWSSRMQDFLTDPFVLMPGVSKTFGTLDGVVLNTDTDKPECVATKVEYKQAMEYMHSLYKQGAIYDGDFTQTEEQMKSLINQKDDPVLFFTSGSSSTMIDTEANNALYRDYECMAPLAGPSGKAVAWTDPNSGMYSGSFVITDKCKDPAAALRWADFFYSDYGNLCQRFGADEGKDWAMNPEGKKGVDGKPAKYEGLSNYNTEVQNHTWGGVRMHISSSDWLLGQAVPDDVDLYAPEGMEQLLYNVSRDLYAPYAKNTKYANLNDLKATDKEISSVSTKSVEIAKLIDENSVAFITGTKDIDKDWDSFVKGLDKSGMKELLKVYQKAYDRQQSGKSNNKK